MSSTRTYRRNFLFIVALFAAPLSALAQEDDYEFMPLHAWRILGETGGDDLTTTLMEGFPGLDAEPSKDRWTEPVDGSGGFDNVAPRLGGQEGPGGLEWDPSPTYRTRYKNGTDYTNNGTTRMIGNNWFPKIPYVMDDSYQNQQWIVRFDANTYRVYDQDQSDSYTFWGRNGNAKSKLYVSGNWVYVYDIGGKTYTFNETGSTKRCTKIEGIGSAEITISYTSSAITVIQKSDSSTEVRKWTYTLTDHGSGKRVDKIEVAHKPSTSWVVYRTIEFTYHEQVTSAAGSSTGDLIGIEDTRDLSDSGEDYTRKWVFKYYTGTYNSTTNPGNPYQIAAVIEPGDVKAFDDDNPTLDIYTRTVSQLSGYLTREYEYNSDRRLRDLTLNDDCGCGSGSGAFAYSWAQNGSTPSDLNTWYRKVEIVLPNDARRIIDYNKYGQTLNSILQEDESNSSSRRWITTFRHDTTGRLTDSYSVAACDSYNSSTHVVTTNTTDGMRYQYTYDSDNALSTVKLRDPGNGNWNYQRKKAFTFKTSGSRRRYVKTSDKVYPTETTTDTGSNETTFAYTYHTDALAVKKRTTTLPTVTTAQNGPNSAVSLYAYLEDDGLQTWTKDGEGYVTYTGYDADLRVATTRVVDLDNSNRPTGVPAAPDTVFATTSGLNLVDEWEYDELARRTKHIAPAFDAYNGTSIVSYETTKRWYYSKLSGDELVLMEYPHVGSAYYHAAIDLTVLDHHGDVVTQAKGELASATRGTYLPNDFDETEATLEDGFNGDIVQRTEFEYTGGRQTKASVWSDADLSTADKHETISTYDSSGRLETTKTPAGTITRYSYDVLGRMKTRKVGTIDGGGSDNMTLVEELFYDDEEDTSTNVGDGFLTRRKLDTNHSTSDDRETDTTYDYRGRATDIYEPEDVKVERDYDNLGRVTEDRRYDDSGGSPTLLAKTKSYYDAWGQAYETRTYGIVSGSGTDYTNVETWRDKRGLEVKSLSQGKVFNKTEYDGAGRATRKSVGYDTDESSYADALTISGDTVVTETRTEYDDGGTPVLIGTYERNHDATGTGALTVGSSGNGRAQYTGIWYDELHRRVATINYGTNGGTDLTTRPSGVPSSSSTKLLTEWAYTIKSQAETMTDPAGIDQRTEYKDWGAVHKTIDNYVDGTPGTDNDRTVERTYNADGQLHKITLKAPAGSSDQVTEYVYGVVIGSTPDSRLASNDLVKTVKHPAGVGDTDETDYAYNAQGDVIWTEDQNDTVHAYRYDGRGRMEHDIAGVLGTGIDGAVRRVAIVYDKLDRPTHITTYDSHLVGFGNVVNEVEYEYGKFGVVEEIFQEWDGAVTGSSESVDYAYSFPTDGTTGLRRTSFTYPGGTVVTEVYDSGTDDTISRLSGRKQGTNWIFQDEYLGMGRLVEREYGSSDVIWTLVGTDSDNNDDYLGLDRFGRIDDLKVKDTSTNPDTLINHYVYTYNARGQVTLREDEVGNVSGYYIFNESYDYDDLGRLTDRKRGRYGTYMYDYEHTECWTLSHAGNWDLYEDGTHLTSVCPDSVDPAPNVSNEYATIDSVTQGYGANGSLTQRDVGDVKNLTYDAWGRLVEVEDATGTPVVIATIEYNGLGQKVRRTDSPTLADTKYYFSLESQVVEEVDDSDDSLIAWTTWGTQYVDEVTMRGTGTGTSYWEFQAADRNFNVVTRFDSSNSVNARQVYDGYGEPQQFDLNWSSATLSTDRHLFSGRQFHNDVGFFDFRARWQDPEFGRFLTRDSIGQGDAGNLDAGNLYVYRAGDPRSVVEPESSPILAAYEGEGYTGPRIEPVPWDFETNSTFYRFHRCCEVATNSAIGNCCNCTESVVQIVTEDSEIVDLFPYECRDCDAFYDVGYSPPEPKQWYKVRGGCTGCLESDEISYDCITFQGDVGMIWGGQWVDPWTLRPKSEEEVDEDEGPTWWCTPECQAEGSGEHFPGCQAGCR